MKRKELSARLLAGALSFSMAAGLCAPSLTAFAAEENQAAAEEAVADEIDIPAEEQNDAVSENAEESIAAEEDAADVSDSENESDAEETEVSAEDTENTGVEESEEEEEGSGDVQEAPAAAVSDVTDEAEVSTWDAEPSDEAEDPAADGQEEESLVEEPAELTEVLTEEPAEAAVSEEGDAEEEIRYVMMNIPYADFYKAEVKNDVEVDAFSSATLNKTRTSSLVGGSYHVNSDGSDITGITYPVKLGEGVDLSAYKKLTDSDSVTISVTNRGQTSTETYTGVDALFESESYSYYVLSEEPSYYKELTVNEDGSLSFGKAQGTENTLENVAAEFMTESSYGDYQLNVDGLTLGTDTKVYGVVVQTDKNSYGLRHMENIWRQTNLSWATGFTPNVHGCPTSSEHYKAMMGQTITGLVYYTSDGIYNITLDESIYVPVKFEYTLEVENASVSAGSTEVTVTGLPEDFQAQYSVEGLEGVNVSEGTLTYTAASAKNGAYTLTVTDAGNIYSPITADFELYADEMPAAYDEVKKALAAASGTTAEAFAAYLKNITSVSVNGKSYAASGRGSVVIINADGTVKTDAEPIAADGKYTMVVSSTGYRPLEFVYTAGAAEVNINTSALEAAIKTAEALKSADYTAESWAKLQTALSDAKKTLAAPGTQAAADASAKQLNAAVQALVKAEQNQKPEEPEVPAVGTVSTYNKVQYKVTGTNTVVAAAADSKSVTSVKIPDTVTINGQSFKVTSVSGKAFYGCKKLKTVEISKNVTTIGSSAFENCTALTKVTGCSGVTSVGSKAFSGCSKLTSVKGFTKVTSIGAKAFYNCKKLTAIGSKSSTITLAKVKTIGDNAFQNCKAVKKVNLTSTALTKIGASAFRSCTALTSFTSKSTKLASIGKNAFYGDSKLATVSLKTSKLTKAKVGSNAFKKIKSTCTFKVPSKKVSSYKTILKAKGAGSKIKVKKL